jgi:hypothetical protein
VVDRVGPEDFGQVFGAWVGGTRPLVPIYGPGTVATRSDWFRTRLSTATRLTSRSYVWPGTSWSTRSRHGLFIASSFDPYDDARIV